MRILWGSKDGGHKSKVWCWGIESKMFGSILLLKFARGSRNAYHTHAFDSISWVLSGGLQETELIVDNEGTWTLINTYLPSFRPVFTYKDTFHKVHGIDDSQWVLTFRGSWVDNWKELNENGLQTLTHGRKVIGGEVTNENT